MVAGATGIDLFLLCVAADDGVMPQTLEHVAVLRHLAVDRGVVAITKADIAESDRAAAEVAELLPGVETVPVAAPAGKGLDELLAALERVAKGLPGRAAEGGPARLHVDRSFTLRGIGTVVTGTLWSGELGAGDRVRILPPGLEARVRSVEVHDRPMERAGAGQRVALALAGVGWREVSRGDVVLGPGAGGGPTWRVDAEVMVDRAGLRGGERLHVHHGTRESPGRIVPLEDGGLRPGAPALVQLRLESPLVPAAGDRFVLRQLAPPDTIGGGVVIDPSPRRHGPAAKVVERLRALQRGEAPPQPEPEAPGRQAPAGDEPPRELSPDALRLAEMLRSDGAAPRADGDLAVAAGIEPREAERHLRELVGAGRAVRVGRNLHYDPDVLADLTERVVAICERDGQATIAGVRDELSTSRRYAQALLEHLDAEKVTRRVGDAHVLRRAGGASRGRPEGDARRG
jgi:selenocysteine-specific elongation factor